VTGTGAEPQAPGPGKRSSGGLAAAPARQLEQLDSFRARLGDAVVACRDRSGVDLAVAVALAKGEDREKRKNAGRSERTRRSLRLARRSKRSGRRTPESRSGREAEAAETIKKRAKGATGDRTDGRWRWQTAAVSDLKMGHGFGPRDAEKSPAPP